MNEKKVVKTVVANIEKCYAVCPINIKGTQGFLIGTEKAGGCFFFNLNGELEEHIWDEPGGIMSLVPLPGSAGAFLSTQEFYSPNDSKNARIVLATPLEKGWEVKTIAELPFVHRFDILSTPDQNYIIACTIKSDHQFREDWNHPGKVYVCELPDEFSDDALPLEFKVLVEGLTKNHGYYRFYEEGLPTALVSSENGILKISPPKTKGAEWRVEKILDQATSDAVLIDLDNDGTAELVTYSPFHGDQLNIFHQVNGQFELIYSHEEKIEFLHALWCGVLNGQPTVLIGHRKGKRDLFSLTYDHDKQTYICQTIDTDCGPANVAVIEMNGKQRIVATNRETDEVAMYSFTG